MQFFVRDRRPRRPTLFPYTTLFRSERLAGKPSQFTCPDCNGTLWEIQDAEILRFRCRVGHENAGFLDRKSTRLNSSHLGISFAVFCLIKKKHLAMTLALLH